MSDPLAVPYDLTPSQRRHEIAAIFAQGVLRLRRCGHADEPEEVSEPRQIGLDVSAESCPDGSAS